MTKTVVVTSRIDAPLSMKVDRLAAKSERTRAWIVSKAIARYVDDELSLIDAIEAAEDEIDRGEYYTQEQMEAWLESLRRPAATG